MMCIDKSIDADLEKKLKTAYLLFPTRKRFIYFKIIYQEKARVPFLIFNTLIKS